MAGELEATETDQPEGGAERGVAPLCLEAVRSEAWRASPAAAWGALAVGEWLAEAVTGAESQAALALHAAVDLALAARPLTVREQKSEVGGMGGALAGALTALGSLRLRLGWGGGGSGGSVAAAAEAAPLLRAAAFLHGRHRQGGYLHPETR